MPSVYGIGYEDISATIPYFPSSGDVPACGPDPGPRLHVRTERSRLPIRASKRVNSSELSLWIAPCSMSALTAKGIPHMAQRERALDIFVVGLGGAGGRLAGEMARRGYRSVTFHSTRRAVEAQEHVPKERCHFIGEDEAPGTAGDPGVGARMVRDASRRIADIVRSEGRDSSLILVMAGLGGGTRSAI